MTAIIIGIVVIVALSMLRETVTGKIVMTAAVAGIGCMILSAITGLGFFSTLSTICATVAVIAIVIRIIMVVFGK